MNFYGTVEEEGSCRFDIIDSRARAALSYKSKPSMRATAKDIGCTMSEQSPADRERPRNAALVCLVTKQHLILPGYALYNAE